MKSRGWLVLAALAGAAVVYALPSGAARPTVVRGTIVAAGHDATQIALHVDGSEGPATEGIGYEIPGVRWIGRDGRANIGSRPECVIPGSTGQRIELGYVDVQGIDEGPGGLTLVAWIRCL